LHPQKAGKLPCRYFAAPLRREEQKLANRAEGEPLVEKLSDSRLAALEVNDNVVQGGPT